VALAPFIDFGTKAAHNARYSNYARQEVRAHLEIGSCKGSLAILAEDDQRLNDFAEYTRLETLQFPVAVDSFSSLPHFGQRRGEQTRQYSLPHCGQGACPAGLTMCN
jgi:hypothetical protein